MEKLLHLLQKDCKLVIGLMSGTSADGMDAALVEIRGHGLRTSARCLAFVSIPYDAAVRNEILRLASGIEGGAHDMSQFSFLLGQLSLEACRDVIRQAGLSPSDIDLVGSHGQTLWHQPVAEAYAGRAIRSTLQLGEASVISEGLGCVTVSDFRVRDLAAGGLGAPLVPYTEYLLYRSESETVALQNIGGIGNVTVLPKACGLNDVFAFDTGPGNMVMDQLVSHFSGGKQRFDEGGRIARSGQVSEQLLRFLLDDPYLRLQPPKTTGREMYGTAYVQRLLTEATRLQLSPTDTVATATRFTAECVRIALRDFCPVQPDRLIVSGGGSANPALVEAFRLCCPMPVQTQEDLGLSSDAKEAVAFAVLANECIHGECNNAPSATGAAHPVVMGKISW